MFQTRKTKMARLAAMVGKLPNRNTIDDRTLQNLIVLAERRVKRALELIELGVRGWSIDTVTNEIIYNDGRREPLE